MNIAELKEKLKKGNIGGAYIFAGEEDYLKKFYIGELAKICSPDASFDIFNRAIFDGEEIDFAAVKEAISSPPMFSDYKLIEWRYADIDALREKDREKLELLSDYTSEYPYAVLVIMTSAGGFDAGTNRRPSKFAVRLGKSFSLINFEKSTDAQLMGWLKKHFDVNGISVNASVLSALIFRSGHGMDVLKNEVEKLCAYAKANGLSGITAEHIEQVSSPTLECDAFALSGAITDKNRERAFVSLIDMRMRRIEPGAVMAMMYRAFSELVTVSMLIDEGKGAPAIEELLGWNSYKIKICISSAKTWGTKRLTEAALRLKELEATSKSGGVSGFAPLEIFIAEYL